MNLLTLLVGALKRSGPLFAAWVALCFATVFALHAAYGIELDPVKTTGMGVFWALLLLAASAVVQLVRRRRATGVGAAASPPPAPPRARP